MTTPAIAIFSLRQEEGKKVPSPKQMRFFLLLISFLLH
jgi:hypothetical protein